MRIMCWQEEQADTVFPTIVDKWLCDIRTTPRERQQLEEQQRLIVAAIPVPPGVETITYYVKGRPNNRE